MVFSSLSFLCIFLPVVLVLYRLMPGLRAKNVLLMIASLVFYAYGEPVYVLLMLVSAVANWLFGLVVAGRKPVLALAVIVNLAFLGVFKYAGMVVGTVDALFGAAFPPPEIALPIGISFYTFQAMSYVIDAYRGIVAAERNFGRVLLYIAFFPQLIAGPIIKYHDVAAQFAERNATASDVACGLRRFCVGLAKKVLIANSLAGPVDVLFAAAPDQMNIVGAWIAAVAYMMQIYFDFSGYSDMAIGMARMFGFHFKENFQHPYCSTSIKDFWTRWHISLSTWFKEYLYIPLGGNRRGRGRTVLNKFIVFFLCGLWHGASWTFVVWGLIHGFFLMLEEYLPIRKLPKPIGWLYAMLVVCCAFVLFRADSFEQGAFMLSQMFTGVQFDHAHMVLALQQLSPGFVIALVVGLVAAQPWAQQLAVRMAERPQGVPSALRIASYACAFVLLAVCLLELASGGYNPFIYFRF